MNRWHTTFLRMTGVAACLAAFAACGGTSGDSTGSASSGTEVDGLLKSGELSFCTDPTNPPMEFLDENQKLVGAEIEIGEAIADSLGLQARWVNTAFNGIIPALEASQCDAILAQLYIKPEREEVVDFVPYIYSSNTVLVREGSDVTGIDGLCGKKAAAGTGTTAAGYFEEANAEDCGDTPIDIRLFGKESDALQQLKIDLVDGYGTTLETAAYVMKQEPGKYAMAGEPFGLVTCGIATRKDATGVHDAIEEAFEGLRSDGTYDEILAAWNLTDDALKE